MKNRIAVVVPTVQKHLAEAFIEQWSLWLKDVSLYLIEDSHNPLAEIYSSVVTRLTWQEIEDDLGDQAWIIPMKTSAIRSYGIWKAWRSGAEYIVTLNDNCFPIDGANFFEGHLNALNSESQTEQWFSPFSQFKGKGFPYEKSSLSRPVKLNMGYCKGSPVLDAQAALAHSREEKEEVSQDISVPAGQYFPFSAANSAFHRDIAPLMYFHLMGQGNDQGVDGFGDAWCGVIVKKILDHLNFGVHCGGATVKRISSDNLWQKLEAELPAMRLNESFWRRVHRIQLTSADPVECLRQIAKHMVTWEEEFFKRNAKAMMLWTNLFCEAKEQKEEEPQTTRRSLLIRDEIKEPDFEVISNKETKVRHLKKIAQIAKAKFDEVGGDEQEIQINEEEIVEDGLVHLTEEIEALGDRLNDLSGQQGQHQLNRDFEIRNQLLGATQEENFNIPALKEEEATEPERKTIPTSRLNGGAFVPKSE